MAKQFDAPLRVNVYQAVRSDIYALSYEEYWDGFRRLFAETDVIAIGEPLVRAMAGLPPLRGGCGVSTVRVTPRATTQPCVYWPGPGEPLSELISTGLDILNSAPFEQARTIPDACQPCEFRDSCHGGCAGRRRLQDALLQPDCYCPIIRGERPTARDPHGRQPRSAQAEQFLHYCGNRPIETSRAYFASIQVSEPASLDGHIRERKSAAACRRRCRDARLRTAAGPAFL